MSTLELVLWIVIPLHVLIAPPAMYSALSIKRETSSAIVWLFLIGPILVLGPVLYYWFGYDRVHRPLRRKKRHRAGFQHPSGNPQARTGLLQAEEPPVVKNLGWLGRRLGGYPESGGNRVLLFHETTEAFDAIMDLIEQAEHHLHLEYYIFQADDTGKRVLDALTRKAREGVKVRLLLDSFGSFLVHRKLFHPLKEAGGSVAYFLPVSLWRRRVQINLRNHRKLILADGKRAITGGMNIGNEYLGYDDGYGYWRDTNLRLEGPVVTSLQSLFAEDWDFAAEEYLEEEVYFPEIPEQGEDEAQVLAGGPDQAHNTLRGVVYGALTQARERLWITTPYFVPDQGLLDALLLALRLKVDVRLLIPNKADSWVTYHASRYFLRDLIGEGLQVYQYDKGYMHAKVIIVDDFWATVGSANFDQRSMFLNFELNCALHSPSLVNELSEVFLRDCESSTPLTKVELDNLSLGGRLLENFCRLWAPIL